MKKIRTAIFGTGFMGRVHTEALRRLGNVEVVGVVGRTWEATKKFANTVGIDRATCDFRELLAAPDIDVIHICTPNSLHCEMTSAALSAGKHVACEKPLATTIEEAKKMAALAKQKELANCVVYNLRCYPQVQNMRRMCEAGEFGAIQIVQGTYSQDWLFYDSDWNWRVESGPSRAFADIGSHWCDAVEHITGLRITSLSADLATFRNVRNKPKHSVETFAGKTLRPDDYDAVSVNTEDFCAVIFRMGENARGSMTVSQVSAGRKNYFSVEIYGTKGSAAWNAERPDELWIGNRDRPNEILIKDPSLMAEQAGKYADLPGGHSEGYDDTFKQIFRRFYRTIADPNEAVEYPTFDDGIRQMWIQDAVLESSAKKAWVDVNG